MFPFGSSRSPGYSFFESAHNKAPALKKLCQNATLIGGVLNAGSLFCNTEQGRGKTPSGSLDETGRGVNSRLLTWCHSQIVLLNQPERLDFMQLFADVVYLSFREPSRTRPLQCVSPLASTCLSCGTRTIYFVKHIDTQQACLSSSIQRKTWGSKSSYSSSLRGKVETDPIPLCICPVTMYHCFFSLSFLIFLA